MDRLVLSFVALSAAFLSLPAWGEGDPSPARAGGLPAAEAAATGARPLSEAIPGVTVIDAAEIRANGYHALAEALRWVRGLYVVSDHTYSYVGVRGLQRPGDYNNKVLIAIDGHSVTGNVYGDAYLGSELGLDLERVERIEVIRGPGTARFGTNAVLAVVNVVTRTPAKGPVLGLSAWTGGASERRGALSFDSARPGWPALALGASWLDENGLDLYDTAFDLGIDDARSPGERAASFLGRLEWEGLRLAVKINERMTPSAEEPQNRAYDGHDFVQLSQVQPLGAGMELHASGWWDGARYHSYTVDTAGVRNVDFGVGDVLGTDWRIDWARDTRSAVTVGAEGRYYARAQIRNFDENPFALYENREIHRGLAAFYIQNRSGFGRGVSLTAGARLDAHSDFGPEVSPRVGLTWSGPSGVAAHLTVGSSIRVPTLYEINDRANQGADPLQLERVVALEGSLERSAGPFRAVLSGYRNDVRDLIELVEVDTSGNVGFANRDRILAQGAECELQVASPGGNRARLALAWQTARGQESDAELTNSPRWNANLVLTHAREEAILSFGCGLRWLSPRLIGNGEKSDDAFVADARVGARLWTSTTLGLEVKNILDSRYPDPVAHSPVRDPVLQDPRTLYVTIHHAGWLP